MCLLIKKIKACIYYKRIRITPPKIKEGTKSKKSGDWADKKHCPSNSDETYFINDATLALGMKPKGKEEEDFQGGEAKWSFDLQKLKNKEIINAELRINSFRTHEGVHTDYDRHDENDKFKGEKGNEKVDYITNTNGTKVKLRKAYVYINKLKVDNLDLIREMENGRYWGYNIVGPYPITSFVKEALKNKDRKLIIELKVDPGVYWGLDEIRLDIVVEEEELRSACWIVIGGIISFIIGKIFSLIWYFICKNCSWLFFLFIVKKYF